jgi:hypothetical protein
MAKKKYSQFTKDMARKWGRLTGQFSYATNDNVKEFVNAVQEVYGYVNVNSMYDFVQITNLRYVEAKKRIIFAAEVYGTENLGWKRVTKEREKEFRRMVADEFGAIQVSPEMAFEFAGVDEDDYLDYLNEIGEPIIYDRQSRGTGVEGWQTTPMDELFLEYETSQITNIQIFDVDGRLVFSGDDLKDYYDAFRELGGDSNYPVYDLDTYTYFDEFGREVIDVVVTVTSYY